MTAIQTSQAPTALAELRGSFRGELLLPTTPGYDTARARNVLPVPADQYGNPGPGETYQHWDEFELQPPTGAASGVIRLLYQPTSWEYIQFLDLANNGSNAFLGNEGTYMLEAWLNTPTLMAEPHVMASTTVEAPEPGALALLAAGVACLGALARRRGGRCARA